MLELSDIQGIVFSGYAQKSFASYLLLRVVDPQRARAWLSDMAEDVTTGRDRPEHVCLNLALTARGLARLGLDDDSLQTFPLEFREGMSGSDTRSRTLGDVEENAPETWLWGGPSVPVDVLLMLYASSAEVLSSLIATQTASFEGALSLVFEQSTLSLPDRREHFGFADGIAQPTIEGTGHDSLLPFRTVKAGEFVLGYENGYGKLPFVPNTEPARDVASHLTDCQTEGRRRSLGKNGSYLVVRQLDQRVFAFWEFMRTAALEQHGPSRASEGAIELAAKAVGRWPSGAPITKARHSDDPKLASENDFGYWLHDRDGRGCPVGAHIRRANPRDSLEPDPLSSLKVVDRHRIMRRGRSYGPQVEQPWLCTRDDGESRGLMFIGVNANIRRQFEFIQQTWINNPKFAGLYDEVDPLIGSREGSSQRFSIPSEPLRRRCERLTRFVHVRGGQYFFLPSVRALRFLSRLGAQP